MKGTITGIGKFGEGFELRVEVLSPQLELKTDMMTKEERKKFKDSEVYKDHLTKLKDFEKGIRFGEVEITYI